MCNVYVDLKEAKLKQQMDNLSNEHQTIHTTKAHHPTLHNSEISNSVYTYTNVKGPHGHINHNHIDQHTENSKLKRVKSPKIITQCI